jgi:hypothetical protein
MTRAIAGDADSIEGLQKLTATFQQAASDPTLRGRIPTDVAKAMHDLSTGRAGAVSPAWNIVPTLEDIASRVDAQGVVREAGPGLGTATTGAPTPGVTVSPGVSATGELNIQHQDTVLRQDRKSVV